LVAGPQAEDVLDRLKAWLGLGTVDDGYERRVLEREYAANRRKIARLKQRLGGVSCSSCPKEEDPAAQRIIGKVRELEERNAEIERKLGGVPEGLEAQRAESKRVSA
jgi:hypothetical protein